MAGRSRISTCSRPPMGRVWVAGYEARRCSADPDLDRDCFGCLTCRRFAAGRMPGLRRTPVRPRVALPTGPVLRSPARGTEGGQSASSEAAPICRQGCLRYGGTALAPRCARFPGRWLGLVSGCAFDASGLRPFTPQTAGFTGTTKPVAWARRRVKRRKSLAHSATAATCAPMAPSAGLRWKMGFPASMAMGRRLR